MVFILLSFTPHSVIYSTDHRRKCKFLECDCIKCMNGGMNLILRWLLKVLVEGKGGG